MQTLFRRVIAASAAILMLVLSGGAAATVISGREPHTNPGLRVYPFCPARDQHVPSSTTTGADRKLVPAGARQVLLCRYSGLGGYPKLIGSGPFRLIAHHLITNHATLDSLASELNALKPASGVRACPNDNGTAIVAFFRYGSAPDADDPVTINLSGCSSVTNGRLQRSAVSSPGFRLVRQLEALAALTAPVRKGILTGRIVRVGGDPLATGGVITVFDSQGKSMAHMTVQAGHRFRFTLPSGGYQLNVGHQLHPALDCPPEMFRVRAGHTTYVDANAGCNEY